VETPHCDRTWLEELSNLQCSELWMWHDTWVGFGPLGMVAAQADKAPATWNVTKSAIRMYRSLKGVIVSVTIFKLGLLY